MVSRLFVGRTVRGIGACSHRLSVSAFHLDGLQISPTGLGGDGLVKGA
jgi:hypothetical protein